MWKYMGYFYKGYEEREKRAKKEESREKREESRTIKVWLYEDIPEIYKNKINKFKEKKLVKSISWVAFIPTNVYEKIEPSWTFCKHFSEYNIATIYIDKGLLRIAYKLL